MCRVSLKASGNSVLRSSFLWVDRGCRAKETEPIGSGTNMGEESSSLVDVSGSVKWFDPRKGFGFIVGPDGQDIFVHYTIIEGEGFRVLADGSPVIYCAESGEKGWRATKVIAQESDSSESTGSRDSDSDPEAEVVVPKRTYTRTPRR